MTSSILVLVSQEQLVDFKNISKRIIKQINALIPEGNDHLKLRKGLDLIAYGLGYTSHPHLISHSKGIQSNRALPDQLRTAAPRISDKIKQRLDAIDMDSIEQAILLALPSRSATPSEFLTILTESNSATTHYKEAAELHKYAIEGDIQAYSKSIREIDWSTHARKEQFLCWYAVFNGLSEDVKYLLKKKAVLRSNLDKFLYSAISRDHLEIAKLLIEQGADINANVELSDYNSLVYEILNRRQAVLLEHCLVEGLVNSKHDYLSWLCRGIYTKEIAMLDGVSTLARRMNAFRSAVQAGENYTVAYFLNEHRNTDFDLPRCLNGSNLSLETITAMIKAFTAFPHVQMQWTAEDIISAIASPEYSRLPSDPAWEEFFAALQTAKKELPAPSAEALILKIKESPAGLVAEREKSIFAIAD